MRRARTVALLLAVYLAADFVDASAPGVFVFDSAFFLGTVVQSKMPSGDVIDHRSVPPPLAPNSNPPPPARSPRPAVRQASARSETHAPLPRDATRRPTLPNSPEEP